MKIDSYETDLSAPQWHLLRRFLPAAKKRGRPRTSLREVLNAILYLIKTGAHWRFLPKNFPPWQTVYHHFRQWTRNGLLARLNDRLRAKVRQAAGKHSQPTAASLDSQTVRASAHGGEVGYDAAKKTKGRKRFLLVDCHFAGENQMLENIEMPPGQDFGVVIAGDRTGVFGAMHRLPQLCRLPNLQKDRAAFLIEPALDHFPVQSQSQQLMKQFLRCHPPQPTQTYSTENSEELFCSIQMPAVGVSAASAVSFQEPQIVYGCRGVATR